MINNPSHIWYYLYGTSINCTQIYAVNTIGITSHVFAHFNYLFVILLYISTLLMMVT